MKAILCLVLCLAVVQYCLSAGTEYIQPGSVDCNSVGISFKFSHDSDLFNETNLQIALYTGNYNNVTVKDFTPGGDSVDIDYADYVITATTVFGSNGRPLLYNIEQPFYAVPLGVTPTQRNYTFGVYCTILAYDNVNVTTNTTDNGHGDHGGDVVKPEDHVESFLQGVKSDGSSVIGDPLEYVLRLKDNTYAALVPVNCKYYNPSNDAESLPFVSDSCPRAFPDDPDGYFGTMKQVSATEFRLSFRAFTFETVPNSFLAITCDIQLCITGETGKCNLPCWGYTPPSSVTAASTTSGPEQSTTTGATESTTTAAETSSSEPAGSTTTTEAPATTTETEAPPVTTTTTVQPESTTTNKPPLRFVEESFHSIVKRDTSNDPAPAQTTTITEKALMKISIPGVDPPPQSQSVCTDSGLLSALYAVVGILATLVAILVLTLMYLMCMKRRAKSDYYGPRVYDGPFVPSVSK